jgi:hypothetical protein
MREGLEVERNAIAEIYFWYGWPVNFWRMYSNRKDLGGFSRVLSAVDRSGF